METKNATKAQAETESKTATSTATKTALLLIDIQQDYFAQGAFELDAPQRERAVTAARILLAAARKSGAPVIQVRHEMVTEFPPFLQAGSAGTAFHPGVQPIAGETVITKQTPSAFVGTALEAALRDLGCQRLIVGGMIAWMCIDSSVRGAVERGFEVVLVPEMVASRGLAWRGVALDAEQTMAAFMAALAFFAREASVDEAAQLLGPARADTRVSVAASSASASASAAAH